MIARVGMLLCAVGVWGIAFTELSGGHFFRSLALDAIGLALWLLAFEGEWLYVDVEEE